MTKIVLNSSNNILIYLVYSAVLLDRGSQTHFITNEFADRLQLDKQKIDLSFSGLGQLNTRAEYSIETTVKATQGSFNSKVTFIALPLITGLLPSRQVNRSKVAVPKNIKLADPSFYKSRKIEALHGSSLFFKLLSVGQIELHDSSIILQKTQLGWIVVGETNILKLAIPTNTIRKLHR